MARRKRFVLAMDIGSSSLRTALFETNGRRLELTARKYSVRYGPDGAAELNPHEVLRAAKSSLPDWRDVIATSGCGFWHSLLGLNRSGAPLTPIFTWADSRSAADAAELRREFPERDVQLRTGCMLRAPYWPAKLRWLRRTQRSLFDRVAKWVSPATWMWHELFAADATSHSMASGTGLYNLERAEWDTELCRACGVDADQLGEIANCTGDVFLPLGDGAASNLGSGADRPARIAINVGTSAAVRRIEPRNRPGELPHGLFRYVVDEERFLVGGAISNAGNLRAWCVRELRVDDKQPLDRKLAANDAVTVLPFWVSERAPTWPEQLGGTIREVSQTTTVREILRALTTSTYYRLADILEELNPRRTDEVIVSGGILKSASSLRILADCLGRDIRISRDLESSIRGAAVYALERLGYTPKPLRPGRIVQHDPKLTREHQKRRSKQNALEERLQARNPPLPRFS